MEKAALPENLSQDLPDEKTRLTSYFKFEAVLFAATSPIMWFGQYIQDFKKASEYVYPQFLRHHLSNAVDPIACAPLVMAAVEATPLKRSQKNLLAVFMVAAIGIASEGQQALEPDRKFDFGDSGIFIASSAVFYALRRREINKLNLENSRMSGIKLFKDYYKSLKIEP